MIAPFLLMQKLSIKQWALRTVTVRLILIKSPAVIRMSTDIELTEQERDRMYDGDWEVVYELYGGKPSSKVFNTLFEAHYFAEQYAKNNGGWEEVSVWVYPYPPINS